METHTNNVVGHIKEDDNGDGYQCLYDQIHRDEEPAVVKADGTKIYYQNGKIHRELPLPAIIYPDGSRAWFVHGVEVYLTFLDGQLHSFDAPAVRFSDSSYEAWYEYGKLHSPGGLPPAEKWADGTMKWYHHGVPHRIHNYPAMIFPDGRRVWMNYGVEYTPNPKTTTIGWYFVDYEGVQYEIKKELHEVGGEAHFVFKFGHRGQIQHTLTLDTLSMRDFNTHDGDSLFNKYGKKLLNL